MHYSETFDYFPIRERTAHSQQIIKRYIFTCTAEYFSMIIFSTDYYVFPSFLIVKIYVYRQLPIIRNGIYIDTHRNFRIWNGTVPTR